MTEPNENARPFDIVVWGATGHTGALVAEELVRRAGDDWRPWALAGRSRERLGRVRERLAAIDPRAAELAILCADSHDQESLAELAGQTRVVCSTVGPFALHGSKLVAACVEQGTHYCDTTGEVAWVRDMITEHHAAAAAAGLKLVPFCGIDSAPSDLGCLLLHDHFQRIAEARLAEVRCYVTDWVGSYSGGTYASMVESWTRLARDPGARQQFAAPYALNSADFRDGPDKPEGLAVHWEPELEQWVGLFLMAPVNSRVVRRTWELMGEAGYTEVFRYREEQAFGAGPAGWLRARWETLRWVALMLGIMAPPTRWLVKQTLPAPGSGPPRAERESGSFTFQLHASGVNGQGEAAHAIARVSAGCDSYGLTAIVAAEAARLLAAGGPELPDRFGLLTPASGLGLPLVERLRAAGVAFELEALD